MADYNININPIWFNACIIPLLILIWRKAKTLESKNILDYISMLIATQAIFLIGIKGYQFITIILALLLIVQSILVSILYRRQLEERKQR